MASKVELNVKAGPFACRVKVCGDHDSLDAVDSFQLPFDSITVLAAQRLVRLGHCHVEQSVQHGQRPLFGLRKCVPPEAHRVEVVGRIDDESRFEEKREQGVCRQVS